MKLVVLTWAEKKFHIRYNIPLKSVGLVFVINWPEWSACIARVALQMGCIVNVVATPLSLSSFFFLLLFSQEGLSYGHEHLCVHLLGYN